MTRVLATTGDKPKAKASGSKQRATKPPPEVRQRPTRLWLLQYAQEHADVILELFADGLGFQEIADQIMAVQTNVLITAASLRAIFLVDDDLAVRYQAAMVCRASSLVEQAVTHANQAALTGEGAALKGAAEIKLKVAAKYAPETFGDKASLSVSGHLSNVPPSNLSPAEAYEALISRVKQ